MNPRSLAKPSHNGFTAVQSASEGSRRFYERHGYSVRSTLYIDKGSPPLYLMSRPAKTIVSH